MNRKLSHADYIRIGIQHKAGQRQAALAAQYGVRVPTVRRACAFYRRQRAAVQAAHDRAVARRIAAETPKK